MSNLNIDQITYIKELEFKNSKFIKPKRFEYLNNNQKNIWDFIETKDSVSIFLYHINSNSIILVRQFRISLWFYQNNYISYIKDENMGFSLELCSGLVDKNLSLEQIAKEECIEELGFLPKKLIKIKDFYSGFGSGTSKQTLFFASVSDNDIINGGGGVDGEVIESVFVKLDNFTKYCDMFPHSSSLDFAYLWFLEHILKTKTF